MAVKEDDLTEVLRRAERSRHTPREVAKLEQRVEELTAALKKARAPRAKIAKRRAQFGGEDFCRVVIPDTHGCKADPEAIAALLNDLSSLAPREIVMLGDHLDCGGFLAQHHTMGYVAETSYTFEEDVAACNHLLDEIQTRAPDAEIHYLMGNHERRVEKWIVNQTLANKADAAYLHGMFSPEAVLHLAERGIRYYAQGTFHMGLSIPATIKLGKCSFTHGSRTGAHAASATLNDFGGNVVYGHTHRADSYTKRTVAEGVIGAWNPGCLTVLQPLWHHTQITGWSHGYGLQLVREGGEFLHVNVPIIDGKSYLVPLTRKVS